MTLREQITEIGRVRVSPHFTEDVGFVTVVKELAQLAFVHRWPESWETRAIRRAWSLLNVLPGYIDHEPAVS